MAYDEGGGVEFQNGLLSTSRQNAAALSEKVEPVDAFALAKNNSNQIGGLVLEEIE